MRPVYGRPIMGMTHDSQIGLSVIIDDKETG